MVFGHSGLNFRLVWSVTIFGKGAPSPGNGVPVAGFSMAIQAGSLSDEKPESRSSKP